MAHTVSYKQNLLQQLRGFCSAVRFGSVTRAAEAMMLSQPSVSLQIKALEREFGTRLFERRGPRMRLTPDGEVLYELAGRLVEALDQLPQAFAARRGSVESGRLDIAAGESTILYLLPPFVKKFGETCPGIEIGLHNVTGRTGLQMLRRAEVDFAVGSLIDVPDDVIYKPLFTYDPVLITPLGHPLSRMARITLQAMSQHPFILPPRELTTWRLVDTAFRQRGLTYDLRVEVGGWEVIKKYVVMGLGVSVVTSICLTGEEPLEAVRATRFFPQRTYGIVLRKGSYLSAQAGAFLETLDPRGEWRRPGTPVG